MNITKDQLKGTPKRIGHIGKQNVYALMTKGGLSLVILSKAGGGSRVIGLGPHPFLARHIAQQNEPQLELDELSKSEESLNLSCATQLVEDWKTRTIRVNEAWEKDNG